MKTIGITAGASAPEELVQELIDRLSELGDIDLQSVSGVEETVQFKLPTLLANGAAAENPRAAG